MMRGEDAFPALVTRPLIGDECFVALLAPFIENNMSKYRDNIYFVIEDSLTTFCLQH